MAHQLEKPEQAFSGTVGGLSMTHCQLMKRKRKENVAEKEKRENAHSKKEKKKSL